MKTFESLRPAVKRKSHHGFMKKADCTKCGKEFIKDSKWNRICKECLQKVYKQRKRENMKKRKNKTKVIKK
jgi:hypothetical protein